MRGWLLIWFDPETQWLAGPPGKRGRQPVFTDAAIQVCLTLKVLFGLSLRQTTGMVATLRLGLGGQGTNNRREGEARDQAPEGFSAHGRCEGESIGDGIGARRHVRVPPSYRPCNLQGQSARENQRGFLGLDLPKWEPPANCG